MCLAVAPGTSSLVAASSEPPLPSPPGEEIRAHTHIRSGVAFDETAYRIKPGDKLSVVLVKSDFKGLYPEPADILEDTYTDFPREIEVLTDNTIHLPLFGPVDIAGKPLAEVNAALNEEIAKYYRFARIFLSVASAAPDEILVLGSVGKPGYIAMPAGSTLGQLLREANGSAETGSIQIRHHGADGGQQEITGTNPPLTTVLRHGDTVIVYPPVRPVDEKAETDTVLPDRMK